MQNQPDTNHLDTVTGEIPARFPFPNMTDEQVITEYFLILDEAKIAQTKAGHWEQELMRRAEEHGATTIYGKGMNFVVTTKNEYDRIKLTPLMELFTIAESEDCFTPAHTETVWVEDKTNMTKVNKYVRSHGKEAQDILAAATFPGKSTGKLVKL